MNYRKHNLSPDHSLNKTATVHTGYSALNDADIPVCIARRENLPTGIDSIICTGPLEMNFHHKEKEGWFCPLKDNEEFRPGGMLHKKIYFGS